MNFDIVTFGSAVVDTFVETELKEKKNAFHYKIGSKILIKDLKFDIGGGATNTAVAFSRFGFKTGCISKIGNDNNAKDILNLLKKEKVKFLGSSSNQKSGYSVILDSHNKGRTILTFKGPGNSIKPSDIPRFKTKWLYCSSLMNQSFKTQVSLAKNLSKEGTKLAFNPSLYQIKSKEVLSLLKITDVLILNKEEGESLAKRFNKKGDLTKSLTQLGPKIVVITDKNNPVICYNGKKKYSIKPHKNIKVVERTGAGDAFAAGFVAGLIANMPLEKCLELALKEGESVLGYFGAKNNLLKTKLK